jgi:hypothetical protein
MNLQAPTVKSIDYQQQYRGYGNAAIGAVDTLGKFATDETALYDKNKADDDFTKGKQLVADQVLSDLKAKGASDAELKMNGMYISSIGNKDQLLSMMKAYAQNAQNYDATINAQGDAKPLAQKVIPRPQFGVDPTSYQAQVDKHGTLLTTAKQAMAKQAVAGVQSGQTAAAINQTGVPETQQATNEAAMRTAATTPIGPTQPPVVTTPGSNAGAEGPQMTNAGMMATPQLQRSAATRELMNQAAKPVAEQDLTNSLSTAPRSVASQDMVTAGAPKEMVEGQQAIEKQDFEATKAGALAENTLGLTEMKLKNARDIADLKAKAKEKADAAKLALDKAKLALAGKKVAQAKMADYQTHIDRLTGFQVQLQTKTTNIETDPNKAAFGKVDVADLDNLSKQIDDEIKILSEAQTSTNPTVAAATKKTTKAGKAKKWNSTTGVWE